MTKSENRAIISTYAVNGVAYEELRQRKTNVREVAVKFCPQTQDEGVSLSNAEYHAHPAVSKSGLDQVRRSPLHFWNRYLDPNRVIEPPTPAMVLGSALHARVLEPHLYADEYIVAPEGIDRRTKEGKLRWADFEAEAGGKTVLKAEDAAQIEGMARSVQRHPAARAILRLPGKCEQSYFWTDETSGEKCKCRPDWHSDNKQLIADVKTTEDASPRGFIRSVMKYRYYVQAAFYSQGIGAEQFVFIAVEKKSPFAVAVYATPLELIERGLRESSEDLLTIAKCRAEGRWPGYGDEIQKLVVPPWLQGDQPDQTTDIEGF
jgi:exodeoxyribonuclease VIII